MDPALTVDQRSTSSRPLFEKNSLSDPDHNRRSDTYRTLSRRVRLFFLTAERNREIAAEPPEGAFRLMEQEGFRRIRDRPDAGFSQDAAGHVRAVDVKESTDLPGIGQGVRAIADDLQPPGSEGCNDGCKRGIHRGFSRVFRRSLWISTVIRTEMVSGIPYGAFSKEVSLRQYTTSIPIMAYGSTFPR